MDLHEFLASVRKHWAVILLSTLLFLVISVGYSLAVPKKYESQTQLYLSVSSGEATSSEFAQAAAFSQNAVNSYVYVAQSSVVLDSVIEELGLDTDAADLAEQVTASSIPQTALINITATASTPEEAARLANAVGEHLKDVVENTLEPSTGSGGSSIHLTTTQTAVAEPAPVSPLLGQNIALGLLAGLALGLALALMRSAVDTKIHSAQEVAGVTDKPVLGIVDVSDYLQRNLLSVRTHPGSAEADSFRRLRTNVAFHGAPGGDSTFVVTAPRQSTEPAGIAANLALALAEAGKQVVVVDADLRQPELAQRLGVDGKVGLAQVLTGQSSLDQALQRMGDSNLSVLAAGASSADPGALFDSAEMAALFTDLAQGYDHVIIHAPAVLDDVAAAVIARQSGQVLVVASSGKTRTPELAETLAALGNAGANVAGIVLAEHGTRGSTSRRKALPEAGR